MFASVLSTFWAHFFISLKWRTREASLNRAFPAKN